MARSKIPIQSEPVDAKELHRRLEKVIQARDERRARRRVAQAAAQAVTKDDDIPAFELPRETSKQLQTPPPPTTARTNIASVNPTAITSLMPSVVPTAAPTRPVSQVTDMKEVRPRSILLQRESIGNRLSLEQSSENTARKSSSLEAAHEAGVPNLQELGQATRLGAKTTSRPSTSWHVERQARTSAHEEEHEEIGLAISTLQRPKSMPQLTDDEPLPVVITEGPYLTKINSTRRGEVKSQLVQVVELTHSSPLVAPITTMQEDEYNSLTALAPLPTSIEIGNTSNPPSGLSSATTALNHSVTHSLENQNPTEIRYSRRSWNPKSLLSRLKDRNSSTEKFVPDQIERKSSIPPIHEFMLDSIPPMQDVQVLSLSNRSGSPLNSPKPRPHTIEPFLNKHNRFSGTSDLDSGRMSDSHTHCRHSDIDSGLGMSDTNSNIAMSNISSEDIPTLMPGAEKRANWNKMDSPVLRDSRIPSTIFLGPFDYNTPPIAPPRSSSIRRSVTTEPVVFHIETEVTLETEPPEDEGIYVDISQNVPDEQNHDAMEYPTVHTGPMASSRSAKPERKRSSLNPRKIFSNSRLFSTSANLANSESKSTSNHAEPPAEPVTASITARPSQSLHPTRPPSRSQPIQIPDYDPTIPLPVNDFIPSPSNPYFSQLPYTTHQYIPTNHQRCTFQKSKPPQPPRVPSYELQHMTTQSIALLRAQEQLLIQRSGAKQAESTRPISQAETLRAITPSNEPYNTIGVAMPLESRSSTALGLHTQPQSHLIPAETLNSVTALPPIPNDLSNTRTSISHLRETSNTAFFTTAPLEPWETAVGRAPGGSKSMVDLGSGKNQNILKVGVRKQRGKHRSQQWWKVWRLV